VDAFDISRWLRSRLPQTSSQGSPECRALISLQLIQRQADFGICEWAAAGPAVFWGHSASQGILVEMTSVPLRAAV
jgi:hypothetical protein